MKKFLVFICFFSLISLPVCGHGEDIGFKPKYKKIDINKVDLKALGIEMTEVEEKIVDEVIKTTGQIEEVLDNKFTVNSPLVGKVVKVLVDLGDSVMTEQPLAIIESTEISKLQAEINSLEAETEFSKNSYEREKLLFDKGISARKDFEAAKANFANSEAMLTAAKESLKILAGNSIGLKEGSFSINSPRSGKIVERDLTIGQIVASNQTLFRGADISKVWANADIYEKDLSKAKLGQKVYVTTDGLEKKFFEGKIIYVGSQVNKETRTLPVKAEINNEKELLKPGAFIQLLLHTGEEKKSIVIPRTAIVEVDKEGTEGKHKHIVYVKKKNTFVPKEIEVEEHDSATVTVISGLKAHEVIVSQGGYQLQYGEAHEDFATKGLNLKMWFIIVLVLVALVVSFVLFKKRAVKI